MAKSAKCEYCGKRDFKDNMLYHYIIYRDSYYAHEECEDKHRGRKKCPTCEGKGKIDIHRKEQ